MIMPVGMIMLAQAAGPQRVGRLMSIVGVPMILAPVIGPALGGVIVDNASWRWIFFVNLPIGLIGMVMGWKLLPRAREAAHAAGRLDWLGFVLLSPGLAALVFSLAEISTHGGLGSPIASVPLVGGLVLIAAFVMHALRIERPLIDVRLFRERAFSAASATTFLVAMALFGSLIVLPLFFQVARGESALDAGLLQAPQGLGVALAMPFTGVMTDRVGGGKVTLFGLILLSVATIPLAMLSPGTSLLSIGGVLFVRGVGVGATMMPAMAAAYAVLDHAAIPRATSALNVIQRVGGSIGTALLAVVLQNQLVGARTPAEVAHGFGHTFWWAIGLTALAALPALVLVRVTARVPAQSRVPAGAMVVE
jgi:EmrB/QacA subfamily drug resistance transporter